MIRLPSALALVFLVSCTTQARAAAPADSTQAPKRWSSFLPLMGEMARKRGIELPRPLGVGLVYYHLERDIEISDVKVGKDGATPTSVSQFAQLSSTSNVNNLNVKLDAWILPFFNVYAIVGRIWNKSQTNIDVTIPPLLPSGTPRRSQLTVPTEIDGTVVGIGMTLAGGYGPFFMAYDANYADTDLGFDEKFRAVIASIRAGWHGELGSRPVRAWGNVTDWNTFTQAKGTVPDSDGGSLTFVVDQGPAYRHTYGIGGQYSRWKWFDFAVDGGTDFHGGWYVALVPVFRM